jgi:ribosomal protein L11 methyltransferase
MEYIEIIFEIATSDQSEIIVALMEDIKFEGFEEEDNKLKGYLRKENFNQSLFEKIVDQHELKYNLSLLNEKNWNEIWESGFDPVNILYPESNQIFAHVRAFFHEPFPNATHDLLITPKMSFGTGHHATTFQMMQQMSLIDLSGKNVIDFGSGTGLLSILAEKMGANNVLAIDNDLWSIENSKENLIANQCNKIEIVQEEKCISANSKADIVLANINLNIIIANLDNIIDSCLPNSVILFSGILVDDEDKITHELTRKSININKIEKKDNWLVLHCNAPE